uniref:Peptidase A1 domain-containing protein n=1 Tax=Hordeum vulgare subsp. vulgare TaxID=112509 RepID=A0A8I6XXC3_HORVV
MAMAIMNTLQCILFLMALIMTHQIPRATADADTPKVAMASSGAGSSFRLAAHHDHALSLSDDGFLHVQSRLDNLLPSEANVTTLRPPVASPLDMAFSVVVGLGSGKGRHDYNLKLDASGSLTWVQCKPCNPKQPQRGPLFDPKASSTFQQVAGTSQICHPPYPMEPAGQQCAFHLSGMGGMSVHGYVAMENLTMGPEAMKEFIFGCSHSTGHFNSHGTFAGVAAMGKMPTSLVMQVAARGQTRFSYCLFSGGASRHGFLRFGADVPSRSGLRTTKILPALDAHESQYYVSLVGISLDAKRLTGVRPEMFARRRGGEGGCVVDPGTPLTVLVREAYRVVEDAVWSDLRRNKAERVQREGYGLCVRKTAEIKRHLQSLSLHFAEETARLVVKPEQLFVAVESRLHGAALCLAMRPGERTVIGALQQVDTRFVYDLKDAKLSFASEPCSQDTAGVD